LQLANFEWREWTIANGPGDLSILSQLQPVLEFLRSIDPEPYGPFNSFSVAASA
jgi:hypothetical protein